MWFVFEAINFLFYNKPMHFFSLFNFKFTFLATRSEVREQQGRFYAFSQGAYGSKIDS